MAMARLRVAACQLNPIVGDLGGNAERVIAAMAEAEAAGCDLAVFPELMLTGYPPEDLLLKPGFVADNLEALAKVAAASGGCAAVGGFVDQGRDLHNAAAVCAFGQGHGVYHKRVLPNYAVFDEQRYFAPGDGARQLFEIGGGPGARRGVLVPGGGDPAPPLPLRGVTPEPAAPRRREWLPATLTNALGPIEEIYRALVTGAGDYVRKSGFGDVVIGLSGGID